MSTQRSVPLWLRRLAVMAIASGLGIVPTPLVGLTQISESPKAILNTAAYTYQTPDGETVQAITNQLEQPLIDPFGVLTGCNGELLPSYQGFSVGVYDPDSSGLDLGRLTDLTRTELPDIPGNGISRGIAPNGQNANPFFIGDDGRYSFLLDESKGQLNVGRSYILAINAPDGSVYADRRILLTITGLSGRILSYRATAIDGRPLSTLDGQDSVTGELDLENAETQGLALAVLNFSASTCDASEVQIIKASDRAAAEPGDTVIYRLSIRNLSSTTLTSLVTTDILPPGFKFLERSARAEAGGVDVPLTVSQNGRTVTFNAAALNLPTAQNGGTAGVLNIAYAAQLTPDSIRGNGENLASVQGLRVDNNLAVKDGPARHKLRVRSGILSDCGTILGRVFEDKNFDGEQQPGEPGIANAVIILDDGNRITTDKDGLYSVAGVLAGQRTGVLDATSVTGYTLAPNQKFEERNSQSRLVNLSPGGLARMNFAVTPAVKEAEPCNCN